MSDWSAKAPKIHGLVKALTASTEGLDVLKAALDKTGFSVFPQVRPENFPVITDPARREAARTGVILDAETTGLNYKEDEIIQLSMQKVLFDDEGIIDYLESFDRLHQPSKPIPAEVTVITGITNEMVAGQAITSEEIDAFIDGVDIAIAFNSGFDRKFCEQNYPSSGFKKMPWFCAYKEIDWANRSPGSASLENLVLREGYVFGAHNAMNDVLATTFLLTRTKSGGPTPFSEMLENGERDVVLVVAKGAPFDKKDTLKERGYSFSWEGEETGGYEKSWYIEVSATPEALSEEAAFLKEIYGREMTLPAFKSGARDRYSSRGPSEKIDFKTFEPKTLSEKMELPASHPEFSF